MAYWWNVGEYPSVSSNMGPAKRELCVATSDYGGLQFEKWSTIFVDDGWLMIIMISFRNHCI